ncbi:MAG: lysophospholipid acyltransferase family protein, partial [Planctomycetota bacterium]
RDFPMAGPVVVVANHTSHFDPPLLGGATRRQLSYLARDTLFVGPFGWLIRSYDAVPVDRDGTGIGGIRATLKRLKQGAAVVLFPEGTRSPDGELQPFKPGFLALVRRSKAMVQPVGIAGATAAWPKGASLPRFLGRITMVYGEAITPDEWAGLTDEELLQLSRRRVAECLARATEANAG